MGLWEDSVTQAGSDPFLKSMSTPDAVTSSDTGIGSFLDSITGMFSRYTQSEVAKSNPEGYQVAYGASPSQSSPILLILAIGLLVWIIKD